MQPFSLQRAILGTARMYSLPPHDRTFIVLLANPKFMPKVGDIKSGFCCPVVATLPNS